MQASRIPRADRTRFRQTLALCCLLSLTTLILYWPVQHFDFVNFDDDVLVVDNRQIHKGLSVEGIRWAFTTFHTGNWHPLTWISHMADVDVYGSHAGGHHRTNVIIHAAGTLLLFIVLNGMTHSLWASGLTALLFAIHPLHVESVAWVSERKDVLSGFFWILSMGAYVHYVRNPSFCRFFFVLLSFFLGILSKPMVVTLPFVFLLLDYWPLRRFAMTKTAFDRWMIADKPSDRSVLPRLVVEKLPLIGLAIVSSGVTLVAQRDVGAVWSIEKMPLAVRAANALVAYMEYVRKMFWPNDLAVLYPHAGMPEVWKIGVAVLLLVSISCLAIQKIRDMPFLIVGWLWYLGTLVPVIGIVQVGSQSMADRYTYIPLVGLFIVLAWGVGWVIARRSAWKNVVVVFCLVSISGVLMGARAQIATWKNSVTLFEHALRVTDVNPLAHHNIGAYYLDRNDCRNAVPRFLEAIRVKENYAYPYHGLGVCASRETPPAGALYFFRKALEIDPRLTRALIDRGVFFMNQGKLGEASNDFHQALRVKPDHEAAHTNLGLIFLQQRMLVDAEAHLQEALRLNPGNAEAVNNLGLVRMEQGRTEEAIASFLHARDLVPGNAAVERNLKIASDKRQQDISGKDSL